MKLFDDYEAVRFPEENLILVTNSEYLYFIYDPKYKLWRKHNNAGNDRITVRNYPDVSKEELVEGTSGVFPQKETDFLRLCAPSQLRGWDLLRLLREDYPQRLSEWATYDAVDRLLRESDVHGVQYESYLRVKELIESTISEQQDSEQVLARVTELCCRFLGRDIFKKEIGIVDGHDSSSYFWIRPARVLNYSDTNDWDYVAEMKSIEISIEEYDVYQYLQPFLMKYFDNELEANKQRVDYYSNDQDGNELPVYVVGFNWNLTDNFYTPDAIKALIEDIRDTMDALSSGRENEFTENLRQTGAHEIEADLLIDFYRRFIYRMEYMLTVGLENGFNLISFMGP